MPNYKSVCYVYFFNLPYLGTHYCTDQVMFPHLKTESLSEEEMERLLGRLKFQSHRMQDKFAILVDKTIESLVRQKKTSDDLKPLIKFSHANKLSSLFGEGKSIHSLFLMLGDILSFFDYEFLGLIIKRCCQELTSDLEVYKSELRQYCSRRIIEVPEHIINSRKANESSLFVKCDKSFDDITLNDIKDLELRLSDLLMADLYLLGVENGCTQLVFDITTPITPLTNQQKEQLTVMKVLKLYTRDANYYDSSSGQPGVSTQARDGENGSSLTARCLGMC